MKPHLQSLILAEKVFQDKTTNQFVIAGTFNQLHVRQNQPIEETPAVQTTATPRKVSIKDLQSAGSPWLFFSLTDIVDRVPCSIRFVFLKDNNVLFSTNFTIESKDRLATLEYRLALPTLPIIELGQYAIEFLAFDEMIGSLRIMALNPDGETMEPKHESS